MMRISPCIRSDRLAYAHGVARDFWHTSGIAIQLYRIADAVAPSVLFFVGGGAKEIVHVVARA